MSDLYTVFGHPIAHSLSPQIHSMFADQTGEDIVYEKRLAPLDGFADSVVKFVDEGGEILVCPLCAITRGITPEPPAKMANAEAIHNLFLYADKVIDF